MKNRIILHGERQRAHAKLMIDASPQYASVTFRKPSRTVDQNNKLWAMLTDISRAEPQGRKHAPEVWKSLFMAALGYEMQFEMGLNNEPVWLGYKSSDLNIGECSELIDFIAAYGAEHGVQWGREASREAA